MSSENVQFLKEHPTFCRLSEAYLEVLAEHMEVVTLEPEDVVFREGEPASHFYIVMEGTVDLYAKVPDEDDDQWMQMIDVGGVIGWSWLVPPYQWAFTANTRGGAMLMQFDAEAIRDLCDRDPAFGYGTMKQICVLMLERLHSVRAQMVERLHEAQSSS